MSTILPVITSTNTGTQHLKVSTETTDDGTPSFDSVLESQLQKDQNKPVAQKTSKDCDKKSVESDGQSAAADNQEAPQQNDLLTLIMTAQIVPNEPIKSSGIETVATDVDHSNNQPLSQLSSPHSLISSENNASLQTATNTDNPLIELANPSNQLIKGMDGEEHASITLNDLDSVLLTPQGAGHSVASSLPAIQAPTSTPVYHIASTFNQTGWDQAISQRVVWMANQQLQSASLTINPEHLGPIQIQVQIDNQQLANVQFIALQPEVRAALQNAIPLLSDMLEQSGIQLGQSDVSSQHPNSHSGKQEQNNSPWTSNDQSSLSINSTELNSDQLVTGGHNLINVYA